MRGKTTTVRKSFSREESAGIETGLTKRYGFKAEYTYNDAAFNASSSGAAGRPTSGGGYYRGAKGERGQEGVSNKGWDFDLEGCGGMDYNSPLGNSDGIY